MGFNEEFDIVAYFIQIAPVVVVMGVVIKALWTENKILHKKINERDRENLQTLKDISSALENVESNTHKHEKQIKSYINEKFNDLASIIKS